MAKGIFVLMCCCLGAVQVMAQTQRYFYPFGEGNRDDYLRQSNDVASPAIELRWGIPFYNEKYWKMFVNDNGVLSFDNQYTKYDEAQPVFPIGPDMEETTDRERILIAPFWGNVDMTTRGYVYFRQSTEQELLDRAAGEIHTAFVEWDDFQPKVLVIATWVEVGFYGIADGFNLRNSFQCIIASDEFETFAIFIYDQIDWTSGTESNGGPTTGIGGTPAQVGFNAGDGSKSFSHQYSRDNTFLKNLVTESNIEIPGLWVYYISSVSVDIGGCTTAGEVKTFPRFDSMLGHQFLYIQGPCFTLEDDIWLQFGPQEDPIALTNCTWMSSQRAWCVVPTFFQVGRIETRVSNNDAITFPYTGVFDIVDIGDVPAGIKRINPHSESWMLADRKVAIEWDPSLINYTQINIDLLTYSETDGVPSWEETEDIEHDAPNTGRYEWIPEPVGSITPENAVGVIRITRRYKRSLFAIWSDVHWLGYMMNDKYQRNPGAYSNLQCEIWNEKMDNEPVWNYDQDLNPCPCDLSQALADRARFRPLDFCDMSTAGFDDDEDYCFLREGIKHCVINIINSPQNADSVCCYDYEENLVYAGDSFSGSFSHRVTVNGVPPYNAPKAVPVLSTWINDIIPYYTCCVWGDLCEYYQYHRPTRDCRWYDAPRMAVVFGDPHFVTFDGVEYSFNGKGEWTLMRSTTGAQNRFTLQGRTEQMLDWQGNIVQATRVTSVAMKEEDRENIEIQHSSKTILQVVYQGQYLKIDTQTRLALDGFYLSFPKIYEGGNVTQVIVTFQDSEIGIVINGTAEGMFIQVVIPDEFKGYVEGLMGNWDEVPDNDLTSNGGTSVDPNATAEVIYNQFAKSWEINPAESLFLYDQGKNHDFFQDNDFVPAFNPPDGNLPTYLDTQVIVDTCDGNTYCIYDIQSTGFLQLGKATKKAYDDYKQAQRALRDVVTCQYIRTPKNGTKTFLRERNHKVGSELEFRCDDDFIPIGPEYRVCQPSGDWSGGAQEDDIVNECLESLLCGGLETPIHGSISAVDAAPERIEVSYSCDIGYERYGNQYRHCRQEFEHWSGYKPGCYQQLNPLELAMAIVGGVVGAVLIVAAAIFIFVWAARKDRKDDRLKREKEMFSDIEMKTTPQTQSGYHRGPPPVEKSGLQYGAGTSRDPSPYRATPDPSQYRPVAQHQAPYPPAGGHPAHPPANYPPPAPINLQADIEQENKGYASETWA
ncbi:sushi domain-containing protein 2-like [Lytechinus variegatus]|uniref:sushi domain-containing protein 2-like n=1 Tax=Lytechinus variegatus TaxID=7654 RepID=UPI001BB140E8|nr:sushi domain-containing protein 2-like [Lytechinus variegatus]